MPNKIKIGIIIWTILKSLYCTFYYIYVQLGLKQYDRFQLLSFFVSVSLLTHGYVRGVTNSFNISSNYVKYR